MAYQKHIPEDELIFAQLELLLQNSRVSNLSLHVMGVGIAVAVLWPVFEQSVLLAWAGVFAALLLVRFVVMGIMLRDRSYQNNWRSTFWQLMFGAALTGAAWSAFYVYSYEFLPLVPRYTLLLIIGLVSAFSASASVVVREYFLAYVFAALLPIAWFNIVQYQSEPYDFYLGLALLGVCFVMLWLSSSLHQSLTNMMSVNWERESMSRELGDLTTSLRDRNKELRDARSQLTDLANVDELTGLGNRRMVNNMLQEEINRAKRTGSMISVILLDVDHFKPYNDTYGHPAGDEVLRKLGAIMKKVASRAGEIVARYGGEEFILILPGAGPEAAFRTAANLKDMVLAAKMEHKASLVSDYLTVSQGIVSAIPDASLQPGDLVKRADTALYQAKDSGRNTIIAVS